MNTSDDDIDWSVGTFEGARIEQMRRWAALPLDRIVAALEEMERHAAKTASNPSSIAELD